MGFLKPILILLTFSILAGADPGRTITNCFVSNFDDAEVTFSFNDQNNTDGDLQLFVQVAGADVTGTFTVAETAPEEQSKMDNYLITNSCNLDFRFCKVHAGVIYNHAVRIEIAKPDVVVSLRLKYANQGNDGASCNIDGRNLKILPPDSTFATQHNDNRLSAGSAADGSGPFSFPIDREITGFVPDTASQVTAFWFHYGSGVAQILGNTVASFGADIVFSGSDVKTIEIVSDSDRDNVTCGLVLKNSNNQELLNSVGCDTALTTDIIEIDEGYRLAGFMQYGSMSYKLVPVIYQRLNPEVMYYQWMGEELMLTVKSFFGVQSSTYNYELMTGLTSDGSVEKSSSTNLALTLSTDAASQDSITITPSDFSCGCYSITVDLVVTKNAGDQFQYKDSTPFVAWTVGYYNDAALNLVFGNTATGTDTESGSTYKTYSVPDDEMCPEMYPRRYAPTELWLDGWLTNATAQDLVPTNTTEITERITQIDVFGTDPNISRLRLTLVGGSTVDVGDMSENLLGTLQAPENSYLMSLTGSFDNDNLVGFTASFGKPKPPCYVTAMAADPYNVNLTNGDMYKVSWYAPASYLKVVADIFGLFVAEDTENLKAKVVADPEFGRGDVYTGYFYHLKPDNTYNFTLMGVVKLNESVLLYSDETERQNFTTGDGLDLECTNTAAPDPPELSIGIDWSSIPEVEIKYEESDMMTGGGTVAITSDVQPQDFPADVYFHYPDDQMLNHPAFVDFRGYPHDVYVYRASGDSCIQALAFGFNWVTGTQKIFLVGDEEMVMTLDEESYTFQYPVYNVSVGFDSGNGNCLRALGFTANTTSDPVVSCLDNDTVADFCTDDSAMAPSGSYMSSLTASTDSNGNIVQISATWVSVDIPILHANDANCLLDFDQAYWDIRASDWRLTIQLMGSMTACGTSYTAIDGTSHTLTYMQEVARQRDSSSGNIAGEGGAMITRSNSWRVEAQCTYQAEGDVVSSFATMAEADKKAIDINDIGATMYMYKDQTYSEAYSDASTPTINVGETVYIATVMDNNLNNTLLKNFECYATESSAQEKGNSYYLLSEADGCKSDNSFEWDDLGDDHKDAFHFASFSWVENGASTVDIVYIHCTFLVCPTETSATCDARGTNCGNGRARRDVSKLLANGVREKTVTLDTPIFVKRRDVQTLSINRDPVMIYNDRSMTVASLFGLFATVTFFCLLVIGYRVHTVRKGYYRLKNEGYVDAAN